MSANKKLSDSISLLRNEMPETYDFILKGKCTFFVGSAISKDKFKPLWDLMESLLIELRNRVTPGEPSCPYLSSLRVIIHEIGNRPDISPDTRIDEIEPQEEKEGLIKELISKYSDVLGVVVRDGNGGKNLWWDILELHEEYSNEEVEPDIDHRLLALLIEEGVVRKLGTTNWDSLIENAVSDSRGNGNSFGIYNDPNNLQEVEGQRGKLLKIHGCARSAKENPQRFKNLMIATKNQINSWATQPQFEPFREELRSMFRQSPPLFIGFSGNDVNIQLEVLKALVSENVVTGSYKLLFTGSQITQTHRQIFESAYGTEAYNVEPEDIEGRSFVKLYSQPLLGALYLSAFVGKLRIIANKGRQEILSFFDDVETWINILEKQVIDKADSCISLKEGYKFIAFDFSFLVSKFVSLMRNQNLPAGTKEYKTFSSDNLISLRENENIIFLKGHYTFLILALLYKGNDKGIWSIDWSTGGSIQDGQLKINSSSPGGGSVSIFILARDSSYGRPLLENNGVSIEDSYCVIFYVNGQPPKDRASSPEKSYPGANEGPDVLEIWFQTLIDESSDFEELFEAFRKEIAVAGIL